MIGGSERSVARIKLVEAKVFNAKSPAYLLLITFRPPNRTRDNNDAASLSTLHNCICKV
jgi:hypothetical protein